MVNTELSNIWSCVTLPDLLSTEKELFDAHLRLRRNQPGFADLHGWLGQGDAQIARTIGAVRRAAESICQLAQCLVVVGAGEAWLGARAAVRTLGAGGRDGHPNVIFTGSGLNPEDELALFSQLEGRDFCIQLIMPAQPELECAIASRSLRWMMERRYGKEAKGRIFVTALPDSPMAVMAREEGYAFLPLPAEPGGAFSALTAATLLPLAVAGVDPLAFFEGAALAYQEYDLRAFENPVWMYAGARYALARRGRRNEILLSAHSGGEALGAWWQQSVLRRMGQGGMHLLPLCFSLPQGLDGLDGLCSAGQRGLFQTLLRPAPAPRQRVHVEMDWKDYDGFGYLTETTLEDVTERVLDAVLETQSAADVPIIQIECGALDAPQLGELLYVMELSNALCAAVGAEDAPGVAGNGAARALAARLLGKAE